MKIEFVSSPPPQERGPSPRSEAHREFADALRERSGEWAKWPWAFKNHGSALSTRRNIEQGQLKNFPKGEFEARASAGLLYVRHVG